MEVRWSKGAQKQFDDIWISLPTPETMERLEQDTAVALEQVEMFPESAPQYRAFLNRKDIRMLLVGDYKLIYQIEDDCLRVIAFLPANSPSALD